MNSYKIGGKSYEGDITIGELAEDLEKNEECIIVLDMKKAEIKEELNAQEIIDSI